VHWFHYTDSPTGSRYKDAENANNGLVNSTDSPYPEMIKAIRASGAMMYDYRKNDHPDQEF
jgi:agarase